MFFKHKGPCSKWSCYMYTLLLHNSVMNNFLELIWNFYILFEKIILTHDHGLLVKDAPWFVVFSKTKIGSFIDKY
jgi:hypothetical protein